MGGVLDGLGYGSNTAPRPMLLRFSPATRNTAISDFWKLRHRPDAAMPRARRRAAARAAWGALERMEGESWADFWHACLACRRVTIG